MTAQQAEATVTAAISVGYTTQTAVDAQGHWTVFVSPGSGGALDLQAIAAFATANSLTGSIQNVKLV